jgi:hypothetical protein
VSRAADATGAVIPKAHITVSNPGKGFVRRLETDSVGAYTVAAARLIPCPALSPISALGGAACRVGGVKLWATIPRTAVSSMGKCLVLARILTNVAKLSLTTLI